MLWYNRPSIAETKAGYIIAYTTQNGHLYATELSKALEIGQTVKLYSFENISDHSAPSIIKIQAGKYAGHLLFFFSNHASQLFFTRSLGPDTISDGIEEPKLLDEARVTYPAPYITREGAIGVQYTIQLEEKSNPAIQWRNTIHRMTSDGGDTWTTPKTILSYGHHQFPYTTPVATNNNGKLAIAFSIYSEKTQINHGLWILISNDNFTTSQKINAVTNVGFFSYIPYEIAWIDDDTLMLSYSAHEKKHNTSKSVIAFIKISTQQKWYHDLGPVSQHNYPGGAALLPNSRSAIYSPSGGGLKIRFLEKNKTIGLVKGGSYSSPFVYQTKNDNILISLHDPMIKTTRNFFANLYIRRIKN